MKDFFVNISDSFQEFSFGRKVGIVVFSLLTLSVIVAMFIWVSKANYVNLLSNLNSTDSTSIIRYLKDKKIPFKVSADGAAVMIPQDYVYDLRLELASGGLAQTSVVGYEIFDKQDFGATSLAQKINKKRATEGELVRTINYIKGIKRSRVHLAIPKTSPFLSDNTKPTASIVLDLKNGFEMTEQHIRSIQNLVSSSVQSMEADSVSIVSTTGKQLSRNIKNPAAILAAEQLDYQRKYEDALEKKIIAILGPVAGEGRVIAKVSADLDFSREVENKTLFDGDNATPRSVSKDYDSMSGSRPISGGVPGAQSQVPDIEGVEQRQNTVRNQTNRNRDIMNYEIPQTIIKKEKPMATLRKISVAIMLNGKSIQTNAAVDREIASGEWSEDKIEKFKLLAANAVGWTKGRDPDIEIKVMKFFKEDLESANLLWEAAQQKELYAAIVGWAAIGLLFTLFFIFVVRPLIKWIVENTGESVEEFLPQTLEELEAKQAANFPGMEALLPEIEEKVDPIKVQGEMIREKIIGLVSDSPHKAAQVVHEWINDKRNRISTKGEV